MRIALVQNPHAGDGDLEAAELRRLLEVQGHEVKDFGLKEDDVRKGIDWRPDILAIAGDYRSLRRQQLSSPRLMCCSRFTLTTTRSMPRRPSGITRSATPYPSPVTQ